ncbi:MAG: sugar phosphate isomerase/epimerase [Chloroflexi bacterium]|jgi:sugar phosphate isomerase/epimerase|nr:sugar phosphate isomerase/epimerase [Chloroflexota bacterium]
MISLSTASLYHLPLARALALAAEAGFDGLELVTGPETWLRGAGRVVRLARRHGLQVYTVHQALTPIVGGGPAERLRDALDAAFEVGCSHLVIHPPTVDAWEHPAAQRWLATLDEASQQLDGSGVRIALENSGYPPHEAGRRILGQLPDLLAFAEQHDLDITFDACHAAIQRLDLLEAYALLRPRVANVHLSNLSPDEPLLDLPYMRPLLTEHRMPEDGVMPLDEFTTLLAADGYAGPVTYEVSPIALRAWSPAGLRRALAALVDYLRVRRRPAPDSPL